MTLVFSLRHAVVPLLITVASAVAASAGHAWLWVVVGPFVAAALLATRAIELSADGISFIPLLPPLRRQTIPWADLGSFERSRRYAPRTGYDFAKAPITGRSRFRLLWLYPTRTVTVVMTFAESPLGRALTAEEFVARTESIRPR